VTDWTTVSSLATAGGTLVLAVATFSAVPFPGQQTSSDAWGDIEDFRPQTRALWIAPGDVAFWQGALRDETDPLQKAMASAVVDGALTIDLLYLDHEGGQRTVSRFSLIRREDDQPREEADGAEETDRSGGEWWVSLSWRRTREAR
jgi:hypothetical protein